MEIQQLSLTQCRSKSILVGVSSRKGVVIMAASPVFPSSERVWISHSSILIPAATRISLNPSTVCEAAHSIVSAVTAEPEWTVIADGIVVGRTPTSPQELEQLLTEADVKAVVSLQTPEGLHRRGVNWEAFASACESRDVIAVNMPMPPNNCDGQALVLPRVLTSVDVLLSRGYTVFLACDTGNVQAPLVALSYLTLVRGMRYEAAMREMQQRRPGIKPSYAAWEKVRDSLAAGDSKRVLQLTQEEFRRRLAAREPGTHAQDWQVALLQVASDHFRQRLESDKALVSALVKESTKEVAVRVQDNGETEKLKSLLADANARASAADEAATVARERIDFFFRQLSTVKKKEEVTRQNAREAEKKAEVLERELEEMKVRLKEEVEERTREEMRRLEAEREELRRWQQKNYSPTGSGQDDSEALSQKISQLQGSLSAAERSLHAAGERSEFFMRQLAAIRESERKSRAAARAADQRYFNILKRVEDLGRKEASAKQAAAEAQKKYEAMAGELEGLGSVRDIKDRLEEMNSKIKELRSKEARAEAATRMALERVAQLSHQLELAAVRENRVRNSERGARQKAAELEQRVEGLVSELAAARQAAKRAEESVGEISMEVTKLRQREAAADVAIKRLEAQSAQMSQLQSRDLARQQEITAATQRISSLSDQILRLQQREGELQEALSTANDHISFLSGRVDELVEREAKASQVAERAEKKVEGMREEVEELKQREAVAQREAAAAGKRLAIVEESELAAVEAAMRANARVEELFRQVSEYEQREAAAKAAAKAAYERLAEVSDQLVAAEERSSTADEVLRRMQEERGGGVGVDGKAWADTVVFDSQNADMVPVGASPFNRSFINNGVTLPPSQLVAQQLSSLSSSQDGNQQRQQSGYYVDSEQAEAQAEVEATRKALGATVDECVGLFLGQVQALREREAASRDALAAANSRIEVLSSQVALLAGREEAANAEAEAFASQVTGLVMRIADLNEELEAAEKREADLAEALTGGPNNKGTIFSRDDPQKLIVELEAARNRADELAAEVEEARRLAEDISESIFNARKKSLQEQQQREELVAEVMSLKDAMEAMRERDDAIAVWKQQLAEQAAYLDSLMVEGQVDDAVRQQLRNALEEIQMSNDEALSSVS